MTTKCVLQDWVLERPLMQQTVLIGALRGPDNIRKYHDVKRLIRWYRRCVLKSALDNDVITNPYDSRGGNFTGPSVEKPTHNSTTDYTDDWEILMERCATDYLNSTDELPHHFQCHFMHGVEIIGYHHSDPRIANWWRRLYFRLARDLHLYPETREMLDERLGDDLEGWRKHADISEQ